MPDDRVGTTVKNIAVDLDRVAVFAPDALGGELDRRQRVLDLMRDALRYFRPGRGALRDDQLGDVVEGDDEAIILLAAAFLRQSHRKRQVRALAAIGDLRLHGAAPDARRL